MDQTQTEKTDELQVYLKKKRKEVAACMTVHWFHSRGLQHMASTRLQSVIQVVFYNSGSRRKRTSEVSLQSPAWMVQTCGCTLANTHDPIPKHTTTDVWYLHMCTHTHTQMCSHTSTLAWCFEGWDSVLKRQAARRSWPSSGSDEQLSQFLCVCGGARECVSTHAWASEPVHECMHVYSLVCVHTGLVHSCVFTAIVHLGFPGATKGWGFDLETLCVFLTPVQDWVKI